jgi:hypothetical protein
MDPGGSDETPIGEEQAGYLRGESATPHESGSGTTTYETTTRGDDYAAQAPSVPPSGPQHDVSTEEAAERKSVQPSTADARSTQTSAVADQSAPLSNQPEGATEGAATATATAQAPSDQPGVLSREDAQAFQVRWEAIQTVFVDDPQAATEQADALVGEVMDRLLRLRQEYLTQLRGALGEGADTEAMRVALRRYRAFFNVLLGP